jgi:purine-nucleoside phosphorylase
MIASADPAPAQESLRILDAATSAVRERLAERKPRTALVLGSGLGFLSERLESALCIRYGDIPGFPIPTVDGHQGELLVGQLAGREILVQSGRFHMYEGHSPQVSALPVRVFASIGIDTIVLTNAAGGVRRSFEPGTLMLIADQVNLTFRNPLAGPVFPGEDRFPDMSDPFDASLRHRVRRVAARRGITLEEGVYCGLLGPGYETPAEVRMLDRMGVDAVGMSTVIEVIVARARRLRCVGISTITNAAAGISPTRLSHDKVLQTAAGVKDSLVHLIEGIIEAL